MLKIIDTGIIVAIISYLFSSGWYDDQWTSGASLAAWPDRFFPFFFGVAEKRVWTSSQATLVLAPSDVLIL